MKRNFFVTKEIFKKNHIAKRCPNKMLFLLSMFLFISCSRRDSKDIPIYHATVPIPSINEYTEDAALQTTEPVEQYDWTYYSYDVGFTGVDTEEVTHHYGNNRYYAFADTNQEIYMNIGHGIPTGFCYNDDENTLYYVNYGNDNFLYSYHDGVSKLLIEQYVNCPNYWNGSIYFLSNESSSDLFNMQQYVQGKLYCYNLEDDHIELILDQYIWDLQICDGYFYFSNGNSYVENGQAPPILHYRMRIGDQEPEETDLLPFFYGDYQLQFIQNPLNNSYGALALTNGIQSIPLVGESFRNSRRFYCIEDGNLWITQMMPDNILYLISIELENGKVIEYPLITQERNFFETEIYGLHTFTILNNTIYTISNKMLCYYDTEKMALIPLPELIVTYGAINYREMKGLYSDGKSLYCYNAVERFIYKTTPLDDGTYLQESIGEYVPYAGEDDQKHIIVDDWYYGK